MLVGGRIEGRVNVKLSDCSSRMPKSIKEAQKSAESLARQPLSYSASSFLGLHRNTGRWIWSALLTDMFSPLSSHSLDPIYFCCFFLTASRWWFQQKLSYPPTQPQTRHLFTPEDEVCDESRLPLRKLAVDSHLISLPLLDNARFSHHTCL